MLTRSGLRMILIPGLQIYLRIRVILTSWHSASQHCDIMGIYRNMCLLGLVKTRPTILEISRRKWFCDLFGPVTLTVDLLTVEVDHFVSLLHGPCVPISIKSVDSFSKYRVHKLNNRERNIKGRTRWEHINTFIRQMAEGQTEQTIYT